MDLESVAGNSDAIRRMEQVRYQVDERLSCAVCLNRFEDPRMLDCRHSFCRRCLEDVVTRRPLDPDHPLGRLAGQGLGPVSGWPLVAGWEIETGRFTKYNRK